MKVTNTQEATLVMHEAAEALKEEGRTADALSDHALTCKVCRSKIRSFFCTCHAHGTLVFEWLVAYRVANEHYVKLRNLKVELEIASSPDAAPTTEWLDGLYNLSDDRVR
jgi:hypothetical protein